MQKKFSVLLLTLLFCLLGCSSVLAGKAKEAPAGQAAPATPPPHVYVADYAALITADDREAMAAMGRELQQKAGILVICLTEDTLENTSPRMYSETVRSAWGLGPKDCLLLFVRRGRKLQIANGEELAAQLTREELDKAVAPAAGELKEGLLSTALTRIYQNIVLTYASHYLSFAASEEAAPIAEPGMPPEETAPAAAPDALPEEVPAEEMLQEMDAAAAAAE